jgi:trimethylamine:corrinoid methyltransferase-like protein
LADRAQAQAERILAEHQVPQLTEEQQRHLQEIMKEAESELVSG